MTPWEPQRADEFFTEEVQAGLIRDALEQHEHGATVPHVIVDDEGRVVGRITLNTIVRGPFQSCSLGYWVGREYNGRGLASRAVTAIKQVAFDELGLHRIEASVLLENIASQRVLDRNGFERIGVAPSYLEDRRPMAGHGDLPGADHRGDVAQRGEPIRRTVSVLMSTPSGWDSAQTMVAPSWSAVR